ncbi:hypothetical protein KSP40_PGU013098 [Platanthera guangdongensis]|uniref:Uncharacterized protein n=1 Tax=Platanthera guangdongensis TaxID=2320717 RepID=A0ABR2MS67_9ASPA
MKTRTMPLPRGNTKWGPTKKAAARRFPPGCLDLDATHRQHPQWVKDGDYFVVDDIATVTHVTAVLCRPSADATYTFLAIDYPQADVTSANARRGSTALHGCCRSTFTSRTPVVSISIFTLLASSPFSPTVVPPPPSGSRLGITNVISTDSIRHMMRSFVDEKENPLLWSSTYHAALGRKSLDAGSRPEIIGKKQMAIEGFKAQSEMVIDSLDRLITAWEDQNQSAIVEGVHLNINFVMGLMKKHPSILPFMMYITNEEKHKERFAVRAKYMALDPAKNKYVKYIHNIRSIQDYLCNRADKHLVPKINNTNVDRSVAAIHATVFSCLRRQDAGEKLYDPVTNTAPVIYEEHRNQCAANSLSSKRVLQLIQRQGSSRHLMALVNTDGSVARAWSVDSVNDNMIPSSKDRSCEESKMHDSVPICKAEPVNLQFGNFGISAWANDAGGTSYAGSIDESSCPSSPRISGTSKEVPPVMGINNHISSVNKFCTPIFSCQPMEEMSVSGTDDEADEAPAADSEDDHIYSPNEMHEEMQGSVDEESTKSDEEYDDLAMLDGLDEGYSSADDGHAVCDGRRLTNFVPAESNSVKSMGLMELMEKYQQSLDLFLENGEALQQPWHNHFLPDRRRENKDERMSKLSQTDRIEVISNTL